MSIVRVPFNLTGGGAAAYVPAGAIWLDGSADYLERIPASASNRQVYTVSFWAKPSTASPTGGNNYVFDVGALASNSEGVRYTGNGEGGLYIQSPTGQEYLFGVARYRDFSAWQHVVWSRNTGNPDGDKSKLYVNGVRITDFDPTYGTRSQNYTGDGNINNTVPHRIGRNIYNGTVWYNGYLAEFILVDGTEYTADDFGEFDANNNWIPKDPTGLTFGTNGFWLDFADSADFGKDVSTSVTKIAASGSYIGDMTGDGGLSAGFNNIWNNAADGPGSPSTVTNAYIGQDHGSGVTKTVTGFHLYGPTNGRIYANATNGLYLYGSNSTPSNGTDGTILWSGTFDDSPVNSLQKVVNSGITTTTAYRYHWLYFDFTSGGPATCDIGELQFFEGGTDLPNSFFPTSMSPANSTSDRPADDVANEKGNYCTINPEAYAMSTAATTDIIADGNLSYDENGDADASYLCTIAVNSGKWYFEVTNVRPDTYTQWAGVCRINPMKANEVQSNISGPPYPYVYNSYDGTAESVEGGDVAYGNTWRSANDVVGVALNMDIPAIWFHKNGVWQGGASLAEVEAGTTTNAAFTDITGPVVPLVALNDGKLSYNFGQSDFAYTAPSGFKSLTTANLPAPTVTDPSVYFNTVLYTGTDAIQSVTGVGFQPDLVWIKTRSNSSTNHQLYDVIRAAPNYLYPNGSLAQQTLYSDVLTSFDSDGFSLGADASSRDCNYLGRTYVAWCLKAGGAGSANTDGTISSTVSVADHGGFSIVKYTGTGTGTPTVGHGLSSKPGFIMVKKYSAGGTSWYCYHDALGATKVIWLNLTSAAYTDPDYWNDTEPTSTVWQMRANSGMNASGADHMGYCFARTPGLIGIGSYTGNGSTDGPYVVVDDGGSGFRPAFVLIKNSSNATGYDWQIVDATRDTYNPANKNLSPNLATAEGSGLNIDFTANGFKLRVSSNSVNAGGNTYIYLAFAEYPFGGDGVAQAKAR